MTVKTTISLTDEHAHMIDEAVASGDYASTSEVVRAALRDWRAKDEGLASGFLPEGTSMDDIIAEAKARQARMAS